MLTELVEHCKLQGVDHFYVYVRDMDEYSRKVRDRGTESLDTESQSDKETESQRDGETFSSYTATQPPASWKQFPLATMFNAPAPIGYL